MIWEKLKMIIKQLIFSKKQKSLKIRTFLEYIALFTTIIGITIVGIIQPLFDYIRPLYVNKWVKKIEEIRTGQSIDFINDLIGLSQIKRTVYAPLLENSYANDLKTDVTRNALELTQTILTNDLFTFIGYYFSDDSLFGFCLISNSNDFNPTFYNASDSIHSKSDFRLQNNTFGDYFGSLMRIKNQVGGRNDLSRCYVEIYLSHYSPYYEYNGIAITDLSLCSISTEKLTKIIHCDYPENPRQYIIDNKNKKLDYNDEFYDYANLRSMKINSFFVFDNIYGIDYDLLFDDLFKYGYFISYYEISKYNSNFNKK